MVAVVVVLVVTVLDVTVVAVAVVVVAVVAVVESQASNLDCAAPHLRLHACSQIINRGFCFYQLLLGTFGSFAARV